MKTTLGLMSLTALLLACTPKQSENKIQIEPLTEKEIKAVHVSLQTGMPLDEALNLNDSCEDLPLPADFSKGFIEVPEDYNNPQGRKIQVFYYGKLEAGKDPVVFYNGGPASDSHSSYSILSEKSESQNFSFLYIDQRGTGCSDQFPTAATKETVERLAHYGSTEIVKDSEVVRKKLLGEQSQWKVFGQSYGGLIVHRYAMVAPQSIKGAYAHGFSLMQDQTEWLKLRIQSQKRVLKMYMKDYPEDEAKLTKLRSLVKEDLCFQDKGTEVCGPKLLDALTIFLGFSNSWPRMHSAIGNLLNGNDTLDMQALQDFVRYYVFGVYNNNGLAGSVISMVEISGGDSDSDSCRRVQEKLTQEGLEPEKWLLNECRLLAGMKNDTWAELLKDVSFQYGMTPVDLKNSLEKNPALPFFLYSGEKDVFVPIETFTEEVKELGSRITYRQFPDSGHEGFYTEPQVWADLLSVH